MTDNPTETPASTGDVPGWLIPSRVYDILKWLGLIGPAHTRPVRRHGRPRMGLDSRGRDSDHAQRARHPRRRAHRRQRHQTTPRPRRITTHSSAPPGIADSSHKLDCCRTGPISRYRGWHSSQSASNVTPRLSAYRCAVSNLIRRGSRSPDSKRYTFCLPPIPLPACSKVRPNDSRRDFRFMFSPLPDSAFHEK